MSDIINLLKSQLGGNELGKLAARLGADSGQVSAAVEVALPMILGQVMKNSRQPEQAEGLRRAIEKDHDGSVLDQLGQFFDKGPSDGDQRLLGHLFSGRQQNVERQLSSNSGLDMATVTKLMATLGPLVMGAVGKVNKQKPDALDSILNQERTQLKQKSAGFGLVESLLDSDNDGDVDLSDLMKKGGGLLGSLFK